MKRLTTCVFTLTCALVLVGCGEGEPDEVPEPSMFSVSVYGEAFIEEEIPADAFVDGWSVTFDRFLIVVDAVGVGETSVLAAPTVFDVAASSGGAGHTVATAQVPSGRYTELGYIIAPQLQTVAVGPGLTAGNVTEADVALMRDEFLSIYVEGTASGPAGESIAFAWKFATETTYFPCEIDVETTPQAGGSAELTIHGDHMFYDDLVSEEPGVAFQLIADSDADGDGTVTLDELAMQDITGQDRYQVGSADITDLRAFIEAQTRTLGHIDGEGHCDTM